MDRHKNWFVRMGLLLTAVWAVWVNPFDPGASAIVSEEDGEQE